MVPILRLTALVVLHLGVGQHQFAKVEVVVYDQHTWHGAAPFCRYDTIEYRIVVRKL